jgi:hypothetical protein
MLCLAGTSLVLAGKDRSPEGLLNMPTNWIITTDGDRPAADIARDLEAAGMACDQVLAEIGCILGSAEDSCFDALRAVRGVVDVAPDIGIDIGPPAQ